MKNRKHYSRLKIVPSNIDLDDSRNTKDICTASTTTIRYITMPEDTITEWYIYPRIRTTLDILTPYELSEI